MSKQPIIFCDFDGTITEKDNIVAIVKRFAAPEWKEIVDDILRQRISIRAGVGKLFSLIPSRLKEEIIQFVLDQTVIRKGFLDFVAYCKEKKIPLYIVSGGIDFFLHPVLEGIVDREQIYCNHSDFTGNTIQIIWPHRCDEHCQNDCGCCKPSILRQFSSDHYYKIVIGDSITDLQAAKHADLVFARDFLIEKCEENGINYTPFHNFHEIRAALEQTISDLAREEVHT